MTLSFEIVKTALLLILLASPAAAGWQRRVSTPKGSRFDVPQPHALSYFTRYPALRDESGDLVCNSCSPEKRLTLAKEVKCRTEVRLVGTVRGFTIYDVLYFFGDDKAPDWKSILIRTRSGLYREIWHYQRTEGDIWPSFLVNGPPRLGATGDETDLGGR
jgi:hypothetical protein